LLPSARAPAFRTSAPGSTSEGWRIALEFLACRPFLPPESPGSAAGATADFAACVAIAWPGGDIRRMAPPTRTGFAVGRVAMAVLETQAWLKYTRPPGWPKQKVEST